MQAEDEFSDRLLGWKTRIASMLSGLLLTAFALGMTVALGMKAPLNFSVFAAAAGAFLLASCAEFPFSLDNLLRGTKVEK